MHQKLCTLTTLSGCITKALITIVLQSTFGIGNAPKIPYITVHFPFLSRFIDGWYDCRNSSCLLLIAPRRTSRIISTASSAFMPYSISAIATITGARPRPATQCTATHPGSLCMAPHNSRKFLMTSAGGGSPSAYGQSYHGNVTNARPKEK